MGKAVDAERISRERVRLGTFPAKWLAFCGEPIDAERSQLTGTRALQSDRAMEIRFRREGPDVLRKAEELRRALDQLFDRGRAADEAYATHGGPRLTSLARVVLRDIAPTREPIEYLVQTLQVACDSDKPPMPHPPDDLALSLAAHEVSEYLQEQRSKLPPNRVKPNDPHWSLVAGYLKWHGWGPQSPKALERRVARLRNRGS